MLKVAELFSAFWSMPLNACAFAQVTGAGSRPGTESCQWRSHRVATNVEKTLRLGLIRVVGKEYGTRVPRPRAKVRTADGLLQSLKRPHWGRRLCPALARFSFFPVVEPRPCTGEPLTGPQPIMQIFSCIAAQLVE